MDISKIIFLSVCVSVFGYFISRFYFAIREKDQKNMRVVFLNFMILILLCFGFTDSDILKFGEKVQSVILVDCSESMNDQKEEVEKYILSQLENKDRSEEVAIVMFGKNASISSDFSRDVEKINFDTYIDKKATDIEGALEYSASLFDEKAGKRVILVSDGFENQGDILDFLDANYDINLEYFQIAGKEATRDIQLSGGEFPLTLGENEIASGKIIIDSNFINKSMLEIKLNDKIIETEEVEVKPGKIEKNIKLEGLMPGSNEVEASIYNSEDGNKNNNSFKVIMNLEGTRRVLLLGDDKDTENLGRFFDEKDYQVVKIENPNAMNDFNQLSNYDLIVMSNLSHDKIGLDFEKNLKYAVEEMGVGLLVTCGNHSLELGNYRGTELEKLLPVNCELMDNNKHPNSGIIFVVDSSGSMNDSQEGKRKIEMAKEAILKSEKLLEENDSYGVIGFSDNYQWVVPYDLKDNNKGDLDKLSDLDSKGGTIIIPSLHQAYLELKESDKKNKSVILLTDGKGENKGFDELEALYKDSDIGFSTVFLGTDVEYLTLQRFTKDLGGNIYKTDNPDDIPKIFTKEVQKASKKYLIDKKVKLNFLDNELIEPFELPELLGYSTASLKSDAVSIIESDMEDPILAYRRVGKGSSVIWTSDFNGKWSENFFETGKAGVLIGKIVGMGINKLSGSMAYIELAQEDNAATIRIDSESKGNRQIKLKEPNGDEQKIMPVLSGGELYEFKVNLDETGLYSLILEEGDNRDNYFINNSYYPEDALRREKNLGYYRGSVKILKKTDSAFEEIENDRVIPDNSLYITMALFLFVFTKFYQKIMNKA